MKKNFLILLSTLALVFNFKLITVSAEETKATTSSTNLTITNNLKQRIQKTIQTAKENLVTTKPQSIAFVGQVEDIIQHTIKIKTPQDELKYIHLNLDDIEASQTTQIIRSPANKSIKLNDIQLDDKVIAMGYLKDNETDTLIAKRILVSQNLNFKLNKISGIAKLIQINRYQLTIQPLNQKDQQLTLKFNSQTVIKNKNQVLKLKDLKPDQIIIYTALFKTQTNNPLATIIMITD